MRLSKRLLEISKHIDSKFIADIGCDHGKLSRYALDNLLCEKLQFSDISSKSLEKAEKLLSEYILQNKAFSVCSDGLERIDTLVEQVIICGMGGKEIISILEKSSFKPQKLILSPHTNSEDVRTYLIKNGYKFIRDYKIFDAKFYDIMVLEKGEDSYELLELYFGRDNLKNFTKDFMDYINIELDKNLKFIKEAKNKELIQKKIENLMEIKNLESRRNNRDIE